MGESSYSYSPGLPVVLEDLEVEEDDEGEGQGNGGDEPVPAKAEKSSKSSYRVTGQDGKNLLLT